MLITRLEIESITLGVSLRECSSRLPATARARIYDRLRRTAGHLVRCVQDAVDEYGGSVRSVGAAVNPVATLFDGLSVSDYVGIAEALDQAAEDCSLTAIGGFTAQCSKSLSDGDEALVRAIPTAIASTRHVCASAECARSGRGINIPAVESFCNAMVNAAGAIRESGHVSRIAILANASGSSPYSPGAFHGIDEPSLALKIGVNAADAVSQLDRNLDPTEPSQSMASHLRDLQIRLEAGARFLGEQVATRLARRSGAGVSVDRIDVSMLDGLTQQRTTRPSTAYGVDTRRESLDHDGSSTRQRLTALWAASTVKAPIDRRSLQMLEHDANLVPTLLALLAPAIDNRVETEIDLVLRPSG